MHYKQTKKEREASQAQSLEMLRDLIKPGDRVYTSLEHVSSSGMSRRIKLFIPAKSDREKNGMTILDISWHTARVLEYRYNDQKGSLVVGGAGMDMGYHVVHSLARVLFRDSFKCIGTACPSNDHTNDHDGSWSRENNKGRQHSDAGYSLTHSWL